jgi:hypothetical protein
MTVSETARLDHLARSPEGRLLMGMTEERPYRVGGDEQLFEDLRQKLNAYVHALRSGQVTARAPGEPVDIVLFTMSDPTARVVDMLRVAHEGLANEGVTVSWRRLPEPEPRSHQEMILDVVRHLIDSAPEGWASWRYGATLIGEDARDDFWVTDAAGQTQRAEVPPFVRTLVAELKRAMWTPEQGTWFGLLFRMEKAAGQVSPGFNYDIEPGGPPFAQQEWVAEMRHFPRPPAAVPSWLTALLDG